MAARDDKGGFVSPAEGRMKTVQAYFKAYIQFSGME